MSIQSKRVRGDVGWYADGKKKPIAYSTTATSHFLAIIHEMYPTATVNKIKDMLTDKNKYLPNPEALAILEAYIKAGEGEKIPRWRY